MSLVQIANVYDKNSVVWGPLGVLHTRATEEYHDVAQRHTTQLQCSVPPVEQTFILYLEHSARHNTHYFKTLHPTSIKRYLDKTKKWGSSKHLSLCTYLISL